MNLSSFQFIILNFCYAKLENIGYTCTICIYTNTCINLLNSWIYLCKRWKLANWVNIFGCKLNIEIKKYVKVWLTWCLHKRTTLAIWKDTFRCCKTFYKKKNISKQFNMQYSMKPNGLQYRFVSLLQTKILILSLN